MSTVKSVGAWIYKPKQLFRFDAINGNSWQDRNKREDKREIKPLSNDWKISDILNNVRDCHKPLFEKEWFRM